MVLTDVSLCFFATSLAFYLRLGEFIYVESTSVWPALVSALLAIPIFSYLGLYKLVFRFSGLPVVKTIALGSMIYGFFFSSIFTFFGLDGVPRTVGIIQPILLFFAIVASRSIAQYLLNAASSPIKQGCRSASALIYGAGSGGRQLLGALGFENKTKVIGFIDDDPEIIGQRVDMTWVYSPSQLNELVSTHNVDQVFVAIPSLSKLQLRSVIRKITDSPVKIRVLPTINDLPDGRVNVEDAQEVEIEDLLGRASVEPDRDLMCAKVTGKVVMVTGSGGSIGSELSRQIIALNPRALLLLDNNEHSLYLIHEELSSLVHDCTTIIPLLGSVCDIERVRQILSHWPVDTIYHAAAYKHVPIVEHNPVEAIGNNVFGTLTLADSAIEFVVSDFVLISTDKAVRPTNVMGATKRLSELILQSKHHDNQNMTRFSMVRFGNVLGSSGSVIPKFNRQLKSGGPLTVTHPDINRFFMTIPEAAQLVIQSSALAKGGEVFVLDMGQPLKIVDIARLMISLSGQTEKTAENPDGDIEIEFTGLRPGEKLYEELLIGDASTATTHPKIMQACEPFIQWPDLAPQLAELKHASMRRDSELCVDLLQNLVIEYKPAFKSVDWTLKRDQD